MLNGYTQKQKAVIFIWAAFLLWILTMTIRSTDWRFADRGSVGLAPLPDKTSEAIVQVYAARTYSWRGAFAVHTWVAIKPENAKNYTIYQVIGWHLRRGLPAVSISQDIPDRRWYGAEPWVVGELRGEEAENAIPEIEKAVENYPYAHEYRAWPGPNSNTFVSYIIRKVPQLKISLPPIAIGKDWLVDDKFISSNESKSGIQISFFGVLGLTLGWRDGIEFNILGLNFGVDFRHPALKLPFIGRIGMDEA